MRYCIYAKDLDGLKRKFYKQENNDSTHFVFIKKIIVQEQTYKTRSLNMRQHCMNYLNFKK